MREIVGKLNLEEMFAYMDYGKTLVFIFAGAMVITLICHMVFKGQRWVKYIPGLAMLIYGLFSLTRIDLSSNHFLEDNSLLGFIIGVAGGLATLLFGLILGVYNKPKKVKKKKNKDKKNPEE